MNIDKSILKKVVDSTYRDPADLSSVGYQFLSNYATPTIKPYLNEANKTIIVGIRGTYDVRDLVADTAFLTNKLQETARFKDDQQALERLQSAYNPETYSYYGVAHSLGGGILDQFIKLGKIKAGRSYNPAIQIEDINNKDLSDKNYRVYNDQDLLYKIFGSKAEGAEVRQGKSAGWLDSILSPLPISAYQYYKHHTIQNPVFDGGRQFFDRVYLGR
jgi:hypothetical protein